MNHSGGPTSARRKGRQGRRHWMPTAAAMVLGLAVGAAAAPGDLDTTFGMGGAVSTNVGGGGSYDTAEAIVVQGDGKIVVAGNASTDFALVRYQSNGSLDSTFGTGGIVTTDFGGSDVVLGLVQQPDGKFVAAGQSAGSDFGLARYAATDGALDTGFGTGGKVTIDFGGSDYAAALVRQSDGKLVAAGAGWNGTDSDFALVRHNGDGTLDTSFGTGGKVLTDLGATPDFLQQALALQGDGKLVVGGGTGSPENVALARYNTNGSLDAGFGTGGTVTLDFGGSQDFVTGLVVQTDGKIVATVFDNASGNFALARWSATGTLDAGFDSDGKVTVDLGGVDTARALVLLSSGKLLVAGTQNENSSAANVALVRLNSNGTLDTTFGSGGKVVTDLGGQEEAFTVKLQSDGKAVVAGRTWTPYPDFLVLRYLGGPGGCQ